MINIKLQDTKNKAKKLFGIFLEKRKETPSATSNSTAFWPIVTPTTPTATTPRSVPSAFPSPHDFISYAKEEAFHGSIYFYQWSDPNSQPMVFHSLRRFYEFLCSCGIRLWAIDLDLIKDLDRSYVCCEKGNTNLVVAATWSILKENVSNLKPLMPIRPQISGLTDKPAIIIPQGIRSENFYG